MQSGTRMLTSNFTSHSGSRFSRSRARSVARSRESDDSAVSFPGRRPFPARAFRASRGESLCGTRGARGGRDTPCRRILSFRSMSSRDAMPRRGDRATASRSAAGNEKPFRVNWKYRFSTSHNKTSALFEPGQIVARVGDLTMGGASSNLRSMLSEEASRVRGDRLAGEPSGLRLSEMLKFEVPDEFAGDVVVPHIATLWVLDRDKDGRFSDEDIHAFADEMGKYTHGLVREDWKDYLIGKFYMQLHDDVLRPRRDEPSSSADAYEEASSREPLRAFEGDDRDDENVARRPSSSAPSVGKSEKKRQKEDFTPYLDWFSRVCLANEPGSKAHYHASRPRVAFVSVDTAHDVYLAFNVRNASALTRDAADGFAFQTFLETLHVDAEESQLMGLEEEELDDYVPLETLLKWVCGVLRGYSSVNVDVPAEYNL
jgi:hypothetical protein